MYKNTSHEISPILISTIIVIAISVVFCIILIWKIYFDVKIDNYDNNTDIGKGVILCETANVRDMLSMPKNIMYNGYRFQNTLNDLKDNTQIISNDYPHVYTGTTVVFSNIEKMHENFSTNQGTFAQLSARDGQDDYLLAHTGTEAGKTESVGEEINKNGPTKIASSALPFNVLPNSDFSWEFMANNFYANQDSSDISI